MLTEPQTRADVLAALAKASTARREALDSGALADLPAIEETIDRLLARLSWLSEHDLDGL